MQRIDAQQEATPVSTSSAPRPDSQNDAKTHEIAGKASEEHGPNQALQLAQELIHALDAESRKRMDHVTAQEKAEGAA